MPLKFLKKIHPRHEEHLVFFKRWVRNPLQVGALLPSSRFLARLIGQQVLLPSGHIIVELGGGTGKLTFELLAAGIPPECLYVVEIDPVLVTYLSHKFPNVVILNGNASNLTNLIPPHLHGKVSTIISGIPLLNMPRILQKNIINACLNVLSLKGRVIQFTYSPFSSFPAKKFGLSKIRAGTILRNLPPATVWCYERS